MPNQHPKVPATSVNCEADHKAKLKLNDEFAEFKKAVGQAAKSSPDVQKLVVPMVEKLEKAMIVAAHGMHLVAVEDEQKRRS